MRKILLLLLLITLLLFGNLLGKMDEPFPQQEGEIQIHFCPGCEATFTTALEAASSIQCAFYELTHPGIEEILRNKGADVLVFEDEYDGFGTPVKSSGLMHNKFCILDNERVLTGSTNPTVNGLTKNNNNILIIEGAYTVRNYQDEFEELQGRVEEQTAYSSINHATQNDSFLIENYFCPEDECEARILELLHSARSSIHFMTFSFTSDPIGELLVKKGGEGIFVTGIFERRGNSQYSEYQKLSDAGLDVHFDTNPATMHHKVFIIDESIVITGSMNPTKNGNTRNDENLLIIHNGPIAAAYLAEFYNLKP